MHLDSISRQKQFTAALLMHSHLARPCPCTNMTRLILPSLVHIGLEQGGRRGVAPPPPSG